MAHEVVSLPVVMRSRNKKGVRFEKGKVIDMDYTGHILEEVFSKKLRNIYTMPKSGAYKGIPVAIALVQDNKGNPIAAVGVIDVISITDLPSVFSDYPKIVKPVEEKKIHRGQKM